jgi:hypothetical protein
MVAQIGAALRAQMPVQGGAITVEAGSGETALALALAFPHTAIAAIYSRSNPPTMYDARNPLNALVARLATVRITD